jgi:hypothetical protein
LSNLEQQRFSTRVQPYSAAFELNPKEVLKFGGQMLDVDTLDLARPVHDLTPSADQPDPNSGVSLLLAFAPLQGLPFLEAVPPFGQQDASQYDNLEVPVVVLPSQMRVGGLVDECETESQCPCAPVDATLTHDNDGVCDRCEPTLDGPDQFCDSYCNSGIVLDNCPGVWNADQKNCNRAWEVALGAEVLGDVCDPVPCPNAMTEKVTELGTNQEPVVIGGRWCWSRNTHWGLSGIKLRPIGSYRAPDKVELPGIGKDQAVESDRTIGVTRYRYCVNSKKAGAEIDCSMLDWYRDADYLAEYKDRGLEVACLRRTPLSLKPRPVPHRLRAIRSSQCTREPTIAFSWLGARTQ